VNTVIWIGGKIKQVPLNMTIHVSSEIEALIQRDVERGLYESADEFVERAVRMLHEQEEWFVENRSEIAAMIKEGYASAQRGEIIEADRVRADMENKKRAWLDAQRQA
jgi:putative addiction module CopG family antidote